MLLLKGQLLLVILFAVLVLALQCPAECRKMSRTLGNSGAAPELREIIDVSVRESTAAHETPPAMPTALLTTSRAHTE